MSSVDGNSGGGLSVVAEEAVGSGEGNGSVLGGVEHLRALEQMVLSGLMGYVTVQQEFLPVLKKEFFAFSEHGMVFEAIQRLFEAGETINFLTVAEWLQKHAPREERDGLRQLVLDMMHTVFVTPTQVEALVVQLRDHYLYRRLYELGKEMVEQARLREYAPPQIAHDMLERIRMEILEVTAVEQVRSVGEIAEDVLQELRVRLERRKEGVQLTGIGSGFTNLDRLTGGWKPGNLIVVAARPGLGKTAFVLQIALHAAQVEGRPVAFFSQEMSAEELVLRLSSMMSGIPLKALVDATLSDEDFARLERTWESLRDIPLYIDETPGLTVLDLRARATLLHIHHDVAMIIVDYLQLLRGAPTRKMTNREQEVSFISRSLKILAKDLSLPVIAVSQLNRQPERRQGFRPELADLRESGAIEQDADIVMFLYRPEKHGIAVNTLGMEVFPGYTELDIKKNRNGPVGIAVLKFVPERTAFELPTTQELMRVGATEEGLLPMMVPSGGEEPSGEGVEVTSGALESGDMDTAVETHRIPSRHNEDDSLGLPSSDSLSFQGDFPEDDDTLGL